VTARLDVTAQEIDWRQRVVQQTILDAVGKLELGEWAVQTHCTRADGFGVWVELAVQTRINPVCCGTYVSLPIWDTVDPAVPGRADGDVCPGCGCAGVGWVHTGAKRLWAPGDLPVLMADLFERVQWEIDSKIHSIRIGLLAELHLHCDSYTTSELYNFPDSPGWVQKAPGIYIEYRPGGRHVVNWIYNPFRLGGIYITAELPLHLIALNSGRPS
jgi:hypothetical protein